MFWEYLVMGKCVGGLPGDSTSTVLVCTIIAQKCNFDSLDRRDKYITVYVLVTTLFLLRGHIRLTQ